MSIIRTLTAVCDIPDCGEILVLNPDDSQPFLAVADAGWNVFATWDDVATICPRNHEGTEAGSYCLLDGAHDWWAYSGPRNEWRAVGYRHARPVPGFEIGIDLIVSRHGVSELPRLT
jgi:hypothetical protein